MQLESPKECFRWSDKRGEFNLFSANQQAEKRLIREDQLQKA